MDVENSTRESSEQQLRDEQFKFMVMVLGSLNGELHITDSAYLLRPDDFEIWAYEDLTSHQKVFKLVKKGEMKKYSPSYEDQL